MDYATGLKSVANERNVGLGIGGHRFRLQGRGPGLYFPEAEMDPHRPLALGAREGVHLIHLLCSRSEFQMAVLCRQNPSAAKWITTELLAS